MIKGLGVDIVEIARIQSLMDQQGERFLERLLTTKELEHWKVQGSRIDSLAGTWAAKEAVAKALGTGFRGFNLGDIEIARDSLGCPRVRLHKAAAQVADQAGIEVVHISVSHEKAYAVAVAIGE